MRYSKRLENKPKLKYMEIEFEKNNNMDEIDDEEYNNLEEEKVAQHKEP